MSVMDNDLVEAIRTATNELGLVDLLVTERWAAGVVAIDAGLRRNGVAVKLSRGNRTDDLEALRTATLARGLVDLLIHEQWQAAVDTIEAVHLN